MTALLSMTLWSRAWVGLLLLTFTALGAPATTPKRILILDPFGHDVAPFSVALSAFRTTLAHDFGDRLEFYEMSLDRARFRESEAEGPFVEFLAGRIANRSMDLVATIGGPGMDFVARHHERLFPSTPIVFLAGPPEMSRSGSLQDKAAQVTHTLDLAGMVEDILQLQPQTTNIVVVFGASQFETTLVGNCRLAFQPFTNRVAFTWLNDLPLDQIIKRCAHLPPRSFILHALFLVDATGTPFENNEPLRRLRSTANAPIFGYFASELGSGTIGGRLYQDTELGAQAARTAIRILRGESPANIPLQELSATTPVFDGRELKRWGIRESSLPAGSEVRFRELTFWDRYWGRISLALVVLLAQAFAISFLLLNRRRRRRAEESLRDSGNHLQAILNTAVEGIITINERGIIKSVNHATEKIFGYATAEMIGQNVSLLMPSPFREEHDEYLANYHRTHQPKIIGIGREVSGRRKDGSTFPLDLAVSEITLAGRRVFTGFVRDLTERKQAEQTAREFGGRLLRAQEAERARLARELHDDITQRLARLAIDAGRAESGRDDTARSETMRDVRDGLVRLSEDVHSLSYQLHPSLLEDLGLADALKAECERYTRQEAIPVQVKLDAIPAQIPPDTALCLFRVAQEALRNVARHARARSVEVSLRAWDGGLHLAVTDTGIGFDPGQQRRRPSLGFASMQERVRLQGGELDIESAPGHGTTVVAWVPLQEQKT